MRNAVGEGASVQSHGRNESYVGIVSDLASLIEHIQERMNLIEAVIASASSAADRQFAASVVVLDDVTPRYAEVLAALATGNAGLRRARHLLLDTCTSE